MEPNLEHHLQSSEQGLPQGPAAQGEWRHVVPKATQGDPV